MKKSILFAAFISLLMAVSCTDKAGNEKEIIKDDALEGENNGTNIGPGKGEIKDSAHIHDTTNAHMH